MSKKYSAWQQVLDQIVYASNHRIQHRTSSGHLRFWVCTAYMFIVGTCQAAEAPSGLQYAARTASNMMSDLCTFFVFDRTAAPAWFSQSAIRG